MTNVSANPKKVNIRRKLFEAGENALKKVGWKIERVQGMGKSSVRRITKGQESLLVSIRTTQDTWIAFPRDKKDRGWVTLSEVDVVVAVSVDNAEDPRFANVHFIGGDEMRDRFDRAFKARKAAGHKIPIGRGVWVSLYLEEKKDPVNRVGAGAGLKHDPIDRVQLSGDTDAESNAGSVKSLPNASLTITEAKSRLALTFGVDPINVKITIEA